MKEQASEIAFWVLSAAFFASSLFGAARSHRKHAPEMSRPRRRIFVAASVCNLVSWVIFFADIVWLRFMAPREWNVNDPDRGVSGGLYLAALVLCLVGIVGGAFGRGLARVLAILSAVVLLLFWFSLGASSV